MWAERREAGSRELYHLRYVNNLQHLLKCELSQQAQKLIKTAALAKAAVADGKMEVSLWSFFDWKFKTMGHRANATIASYGPDVRKCFSPYLGLRIRKLKRRQIYRSTRRRPR